MSAALAGLDWSQTTPVGSGQATGFSLDAAEVYNQTAVIRTHAQTMRTHAAHFQDSVRQLRF